MESQFMAKAIELSSQCISKTDGGPFGAVVVKNNEVVGMGSNLVTSDNDPTAHAEVTAIRDACKNLHSYNLSGCEIYTNCEPCPMCLGAIYWSRIDKIYFAANRIDAASIGFNDQFFYDELSKPINERNIPMEECCREDALEVFKSWDKKEDKVMY